MAWAPPGEETGYDGEATLVAGDQAIEVIVHLDGHLEPLDGRFHWYGRMERSAALAAVKDAGAREGMLTIGDGAPVTVRLAEYDPWGHVQVNGTGKPPYRRDPIEVDLPSG
ncbi:MAG TPA: DUF4873 domain-containing protein [Aeromicrobium sp.]|nr:DUF4873 domain-containing protein [Aeromicrobium sp.]